METFRLAEAPDGGYGLCYTGDSARTRAVVSWWRDSALRPEAQREAAVATVSPTTDQLSCPGPPGACFEARTGRDGLAAA